MYRIEELFDLNHTLAFDYFKSFDYPFEALCGIKDLILQLGSSLPKEEYDEISSNVWVHKSAKIFTSAYICSPCIIGSDTEVRHCAFIRGSALVGSKVVIGNSTELKNVILFDEVQVPHYNYVGDSILGYKAHMGAGSITSNLKSDKKNIVITDLDGRRVATNLQKMGAMIGDYAEIGCNAVLNPGTIIGRRSNIYPLSSVRGIIPENSIFKRVGDIVQKKES